VLKTNETDYQYRNRISQNIETEYQYTSRDHYCSNS